MHSKIFAVIAGVASLLAPSYYIYQTSCELALTHDKFANFMAASKNDTSNATETVIEATEQDRDDASIIAALGGMMLGTALVVAATVIRVRSGSFTPTSVLLLALGSSSIVGGACIYGMTLARPHRTIINNTHVVEEAEFENLNGWRVEFVLPIEHEHASWNGYKGIVLSSNPSTMTYDVHARGKFTRKTLTGLKRSQMKVDINTLNPNKSHQSMRAGSFDILDGLNVRFNITEGGYRHWNGYYGIVKYSNMHTKTYDVLGTGNIYSTTIRELKRDNLEVVPEPFSILKTLGFLLNAAFGITRSAICMMWIFAVTVLLIAQGSFFLFSFSYSYYY